VTANGNVTANTTGADHLNISTSGLNSSRNVNRYWTLIAGGGITFSPYDATFTFVSGDVDGGSSTGNFVVRRFDGTWAPTTTGTRTSTTTQATNVSAMGDFAVGEQQVDHFIFSLANSQRMVRPLTGTNTLTAQDLFNATVTSV